MENMVPFARMNGAGNEILVVDMRGRSDQVTPEAALSLAQAPDTKFDQIMAIHDPKSNGTDAYIMILNADGSEAQACGNGTRCVVSALAAETGEKVYTFQTLGGILNAQEVADNVISVDMGVPEFRWDKIPLEEEFADTSKIELQIGPIDDPVLHSPSAVSMGNPHVVFWVDNDVWSYDLAKFGPLLENHPIFPERANISIAQVTGPDQIEMRTWERGAGLTLACGSGACAVGVNAARTERTGKGVRIKVPSGAELTIEWRDDHHVMMTGPAEWEWSGMVDPETGLFEKDSV